MPLAHQGYTVSQKSTILNAIEAAAASKKCAPEAGAAGGEWLLPLRPLGWRTIAFRSNSCSSG